MSDTARELAELYTALTGAPLPIRLRAWDGSEAGGSSGVCAAAAAAAAAAGSPEAEPTAVLRSPAALRRLAWHPNELGLAQAYVTGELDLEGDLTEALRRFRPETATPAGAPARNEIGRAHV